MKNIENTETSYDIALRIINSHQLVDFCSKKLMTKAHNPQTIAINMRAQDFVKITKRNENGLQGIAFCKVNVPGYAFKKPFDETVSFIREKLLDALTEYTEILIGKNLRLPSTFVSNLQRFKILNSDVSESSLQNIFKSYRYKKIPIRSWKSNHNDYMKRMIWPIAWSANSVRELEEYTNIVLEKPEDERIKFIGMLLEAYKDIANTMITNLTRGHHSPFTELVNSISLNGQQHLLQSSWMLDLLPQDATVFDFGTEKIDLAFHRKDKIRFLIQTNNADYGQMTEHIYNRLLNSQLLPPGLLPEVKYRKHFLDTRVSKDDIDKLNHQFDGLIDGSIKKLIFI